MGVEFATDVATTVDNLKATCYSRNVLDKSDEKESTFIVDSQRNLPQAERG